MTDERRFGSTAALCWLVGLCEGVDLQAAGVVAPKLAPLFRLDPNQLAWFFSASTLGLLFGATIGGRVADRIGRKPTLIVAVVLFGLFSLATALANSYPTLLLARGLTGLGLGGALPNLIALVSENAGDKTRGRAVALMYCALPLGGILAALVTLLGLGGQDWRPVFYVGGLAPLVLAPLLWRLLPESVSFTQERAAIPPAMTQVLFGGGRLAATLLLWTSFFFGLLALQLLLNWLPTLLVARGLSRPDAAWVQVAFNLAGAAGVVGVGVLIDGRMKTVLVVAAFVALTIGLWLLNLLPTSFALALALGGLIGLAVISVQSILYALAPSFYPTAIRGAGVGAAVAFGRLGSIAGPLVAGMILAGGHTSGDVLASLLPIVLIAFVASVFLARRPAAAT